MTTKKDLLLLLLAVPHCIDGMFLEDHNGVYRMNKEGLLVLDVEGDDYGYLFAKQDSLLASSSIQVGALPAERVDKAFLRLSVGSVLEVKAASDDKDEKDEADDKDDKAAGKEEEEECNQPSIAGPINPKVTKMTRSVSADMLLGSPEDSPQERTRKLQAYYADAKELEATSLWRRRIKERRAMMQTLRTSSGEDPNTQLLHGAFKSLIKTWGTGEDTVQLAKRLLVNPYFNPTRKGYSLLRSVCAADRGDLVEVLLQHPAVDPRNAPGDLMAECYEAGSFNAMAVLIRDGRLPLSEDLFKAISGNPKASSLHRELCFWSELDKTDRASEYQINNDGLLELDVEGDDYRYLFAGQRRFPGNAAISADKDKDDKVDDKAAGKEEEDSKSSKSSELVPAEILLSLPVSEREAFLADVAELQRTNRRPVVSWKAAETKTEKKPAVAEEDILMEEIGKALVHTGFMSLIQDVPRSASALSDAQKILQDELFDPTRFEYVALRRACEHDRDDLLQVLLLHPAVDMAAVPDDLMLECYRARSFAAMAVLVRDARLPIANGLFKTICCNPSASALHRVLLQDPRFQGEAHTRFAMAAATERGDISLVKLLLEEIHAAPSKKALMAAITANQLEIFRLLLAHPGLVPSAFENKALFEAAKLGREEMTRLLLAHPLVIVALTESPKRALRLFHEFKHQAIAKIWMNQAKIFQPFGWDKIRFPHPNAQTLKAAMESDEDAPSLVVLRLLLPALPFLSLSPRLQLIIDCLAQGASKEALIAFIEERVWMHDQADIRQSLLAALRELKRQAVADGDHTTFVAIRQTGLLD